MISIVVLAILLTIAVPSFQSATLTTQLRTTTNNLIAGAILARSEAIKRNAVVTLCVSADGANCAAGDWQQGWIVACRSNDGASCVAGGANWLVFEQQGAAASGLQIIEAGGAAQINFQPTGVGATAASFKVCRSYPLGSQERVLRIDATGRTISSKTSTATCP